MEESNCRAVSLPSSFNQGRLVKTGQKIQKLRRDLEQMNEQLHVEMERETQLERQQLEDAVRRYNGKVQEVRRRPNIQTLEERRQDTAYAMQDTLDDAQHDISRLIRSIERDRQLSPEQKMQMIDVINERVSEALMDNEERALMQQLQSALTSFVKQRGGKGDSGNVRMLRIS